MAVKKTEFVNTPNISQIQLYLEITEGVQDVVNNQTTITYKAYLYNAKYNYYYNWTDTSMTVTVNGTAVATNSAVKYDFRTGPREQAILTGTAVIPHNSDGTKTLASSVALKGVSNRGPGTITLNLSLPLTTIPRATEFTAMSAFNSSSESISVTADVKSTAFTNKFSLVVNSKSIGSWTNPTFSSGNASLALSTTHRNNLLAALPTQTSATATMTLQTLSGTTVVGTRTRSATYTILADVKPVITSSTIGNVPATTTGAISNTSRAYAIQGVSTISVSWSHTIPTGTTLASSTVSMGEITENTNPASFQATTDGTNTAEITVKDKRGRKATESLSIYVTAYSPISAQLLYLGRPRAEGSNQARLQAEVKHVVSTLSGNKYDVIIQTKAVGTSTWTTVLDLDPHYIPDATHTRDYNPTTVYDELKAFDTMITVKDDYSTATLLGVLPTTAYPLVIGKYGIGVGKVPQGDRVLDVQGDAYIDGFPIHKKITDLIPFPASSSWYRVLEVSGRSFYLELLLYRQYTSPAPEIHRLGISATYTGGGITKIDSHGTKIFTNARLLYDTNAGRCYVDLKYNNTSYGNTARLFYDYYSMSEDGSTSSLILPGAANAVAESTSGYTVFSQVAL